MIFDQLVACRTFKVVDRVDDEFIGTIQPAIVHNISRKLLLTKDLRCGVVAGALKKLATEPNAALTIISTLLGKYVGLPPPPTLRAMVVAGLKEVLPEKLEDIKRKKREALIAAREASRKQIGDVIVDLDDEIVIDEQGKTMIMDSPENYYRSIDFATVFEKVEPETGLPAAALDDDFYDYICGLFMGTVPKEAIPDQYRDEIEKVLESPCLRLEKWSKEDHYLETGLRLVAISAEDGSERFYVRRSEVQNVWKSLYAEESNEHSDKEIFQIVSNRYIGIAMRSFLREISNDRLLKGLKVVFPAQPRLIGTKPMQYIQVDVVEMEQAFHDCRQYCQALIVTDLYSGFVFGKPLLFLDPEVLAEFITQFVGEFGPPVAYRTASMEYKQTIETAMAEVSDLFGVKIRFTGQGPIITKELESDIYTRAEKGDIGDRNQWVMGFPFAVIQYNHIPSRKFDYFLSPFEVMFKRKAWATDMPPWINSETLDVKKAIMLQHYFRRKRVPKPQKIPPMMDPEKVFTVSNSEKIDEKQKDDFLLYMANRVEETFDDLIERFTMPTTQPIYDQTGRITDPGSGQRFEIGDKVYVRNPLFFNKNRVPNRYYRACVVDVDEKYPEMMYRCIYWKDDQDVVDSLPINVWPSIEDEEVSDGFEGWFAWWDVVGPTSTLNKNRLLDPLTRLEHRLCQCGCGRKVKEKGCNYDEKCCVFVKRSCEQHKRARLKLFEMGHLFDDELFNNMLKEVIPLMKFDFESIKTKMIRRLKRGLPVEEEQDDEEEDEEEPLRDVDGEKPEQKLLDVTLPSDFLNYRMVKEEPGKPAKRGRKRAPGRRGRPKRARKSPGNYECDFEEQTIVDTETIEKIVEKELQLQGTSETTKTEVSEKSPEETATSSSTREKRKVRVNKKVANYLQEMRETKPQMHRKLKSSPRKSARLEEGKVKYEPADHPYSQ